MLNQLRRTILLLIFNFSKTLASIGNECANFTTLTEASRSRYFSSYWTTYSDRSLTGWFRLNGSAGSHIATSCVPSRHCGTLRPGWMRGKHPNAEQGVVGRFLCLTNRQLCCSMSVSLLVRNCSGFYVYKLNKVSRSLSPNFRVCGNGLEGPFLSSRKEHIQIKENIAEECVNYSELNELDRAAHYFSYHTLKCDANLPGAWYRFTGRAGTVMPTKCVPKLHCGTLSPGWLNGKHPAVREGQVERMVCFTKEDNCCYWYSSVKVRNCGKYFVYKFGQLPASRPFCSLRYCGAGTQGCKDKVGNIYEVNMSWKPNPLITCNCGRDLRVSCRKTQGGCWSIEGKAYRNRQKWLKNSLTMCTCVNKQIACTNLSRPACTDVNGVVRQHGNQWFQGACFNCTCIDGVVSCVKYHVAISYGLFKAKAVGTCMPCHRAWEDIRPADKGTVSNCEVFFQLKKTNKLFQCTNGAFIRKEHTCNGITECGDGSDEESCGNVICRDESGQVLILRHTWQVTKCIRCKCVAGLLQCQRTLRVNFVGKLYAYLPLTEKCNQPACNVVNFLRDRRDGCEAIETTKGGRILSQGEIWEYQGCRFHFTGPKEKLGCPEMLGPRCQMYNGAVCCAKQCPALPQLASQMRWNVTVCPEQLQISARNDKCDTPHRNCHQENSFCDANSTCSDEESNLYFEGVTWFLSGCIKCECSLGLISCVKRMTFLTSTVEDIEHCNQPNCNIVAFLNSHRSYCQACHWKNQTLPDGYRWKENGVDFFCSSQPRVKLGCYLTTNNIFCTGAFTGIRELRLISHKQLFLCESGDEITSLNNRCNKKNDCVDDSDEKDCDRYYCPSHKKFNLAWNRSASGTVVHRKCSEVDPVLEGQFSGRCEEFPTYLQWKYKERCDCEIEALRRFRSELTTVNKSNLLEVTKELLSEAGNFTNKRVFFSYLKNLFQIGQLLLTPISDQNDQQAHDFCQAITKAVNDDNFNTDADVFCSGNVKSSWRRTLFENVKKFSCQAPNWTSVYQSSCLSSPFFSDSKPPPSVGHRHDSPIHIDPRPGITLFWVRPVLNLKIDYNQLHPAEIGVPRQDSTSFQITNGSGVENYTHEFGRMSPQVNCSWLEYDANGSVKIKTWNAVDRGEQQNAVIQSYLELVLSSISTVTVIMSLVILSLLRIKNSERIFVHKNLLVSLCVVYIVMILDAFVLTNRKQTPQLCTAMAVFQHVTHIAIFSWMLVEGIHLYIKVVKVFSVRKLYITYVCIGWGFPLIIVGLIAAVRPQTYDMAKTYYRDVTCGSLKLSAEIIRDRCWLHDGEWLYKGPILAILLVNVFIFLILLRVIFTKISVKYQANKIQMAKKGMKSIAALLPLLGVTWLLGFLAQLSEVLLYLFIILNSTQGLLFCILHGLLDRQIKENLTRSLRRLSRVQFFQRDKKKWNASTTTQVSIVDLPSRRENYNKHRSSFLPGQRINALETKL
ncbi:uncharacterized protein [Acropora muricata]|uniref:uncharacterized protein n=1 Tax=Acropora muricata TaxID=159855 RepID=UPI0034E601AC